MNNMDFEKGICVGMLLGLFIGYMILLTSGFTPRQMTNKFHKEAISLGHGTNVIKYIGSNPIIVFEWNTNLLNNSTNK